MKKNGWAKLALLFFSLSACVEAQEEHYSVVGNEAAAELEPLFKQVFEQADVIHVFYTDYREMGSIPFTLQMAREQWRYSYSLRCRGVCEVKAEKLFTALISAKAVPAGCSGKVAGVIEFENGKGVFHEIIIDYLGVCFTSGNKSYFLENSFYSLLKKPMADLWRMNP